MPVSAPKMLESPHKTRYALLRALIHPDETGGYWAEVPALNCVTQGDTLREAEANILEAAAACIDDYPAINDCMLAFEVCNA